tara:strand:- start:354 stop:641 length:288 start_codon:yes stop_codon:yes gene_type:complete
MAINPTDIEKLAVLARIKLNDATIAETARSISDVLLLVDQLKAADTAGVNPMANPTDAVQSLRADEITEYDQRKVFQEIAPSVENGLYLVPKVID